MMADPGTSNDFVMYPPRGRTLLSGASQSQDSGAKDQSLDVSTVGGKPNDTAKSVLGISTACSERDAVHKGGLLAVQVGEFLTGLKNPFWDFSRDLVAGSAAALEPIAAQRATLPVLDEHRSAITADVVPPATGRCAVSKGRIAAEHHCSIFGRRLLDHPHCHGRYRYDLVVCSGHFSVPCISPPRRKHSNRIAEVAL